jgi:hypothetical protein
MTIIQTMTGTIKTASIMTIIQTMTGTIKTASIMTIIQIPVMTGTIKTASKMTINQTMTRSDEINGDNNHNGDYDSFLPHSNRCPTYEMLRIFEVRDQVLFIVPVLVRVGTYWNAADWF